MTQLKLGLVLDALQLPLRAAIEHAASLSVRGLELSASGDIHPDKLGTTARREIRTLFKHADLEIAAIAIPLRRGLDCAEDQQPRLDYIRKRMELGFELGTRAAVLPMPTLPAKESPAAVVLYDSLTELAKLADRIGVRVALEAGLDAGPALAEFLDAYDPGLAITFDPANFLANGHDPVDSLVALGSRVTHVQARDARGKHLAGGAKEVACGTGDVDWFTLTATLASFNYDRFAVVDREDGAQRAVDIAAGVRFLRRFTS